MRVTWHDNGWRRRFAWLPLFLHNGSSHRMIWMERYWSRFMGEYVEVSLDEPHPTKDPQQ